jgi:uncharacterized metal-binding protein YceD (DUF177 family)
LSVLSRPVRIEGVGPAHSKLRVAPTPEELRALAEVNGLEAVERLAVELELVREGRSTLRVRGRLEADVVYSCVVTLEPVPGHVSEEIDVRFRDGPSFDAPGGEVSMEAEDPPEPAPGGMADVGAIVAEYLTLGLDPYPRAPGASLDDMAPRPARESPFAALRQLKTSRDGDVG